MLRMLTVLFTNWIATEILLANAENSAQKISKFIHVGLVSDFLKTNMLTQKNLFALKNYHALFGIYLGLSLIADYSIGWKVNFCS